MKDNNTINLIYLLGAGRSGTTLLATLLNDHNDIDTVGEMHQFYEFLEQDKNCSCGKKMCSCSVWNLPQDLSINISAKREYCKKVESHKKIPSLLLAKKNDHCYNDIQEELFSTLKRRRPSKWHLDSSKYIARFLLLNRNKKFNVKGIYLVRDPRGVVNSFQKKVQTSKSPLSTLIYYNLINLFGEIVYRTNNDVLKVRYEDLVEEPEKTLSKIYEHVFEKKSTIINIPKNFVIPHIVGGNRIKTSRKIQLKKDDKWLKNILRYKQIIYYYLCFPFMKINKYKA